MIYEILAKEPTNPAPVAKEPTNPAAVAKEPTNPAPVSFEKEMCKIQTKKLGGGGRWATRSKGSGHWTPM